MPGAHRPARGPHQQFPVRVLDLFGNLVTAGFTGATTNIQLALDGGVLAGVTGLNAVLCAVSVIMNPKVFKWLVPSPENSPGGGTSFQTPNYFPATFSWKNIENEFTNPDNTIGYFRAVLQAGSMPMHPQYGWAFLHCVNSASTALQTPAGYYY